jgi:SNF2 family DNA or RNA helicase
MSESEPVQSRKSELLDELVNAKQRREILRQEYRSRKADYEMLEEIKKALEVQVKELQNKLTRVSQDYHKSNFEAKRIESLGKECSDEVSRLERELSRILDAERLKAELSSKAKAFRESCLNAAWRAENRTDGMGAKSYQIDGAVHISVAQRAMLGDDMGLGKTLTALVTCDMTDAKKVIVVCPSDTMHNFKRECILWTPHRFPVVLGQLTRDERDFILPALQESDHFMLIVNYEAWRKDTDLLPALKALKADTIIIDESHNIMHGDTGAAQGVHQLVFAGNYCPNCYNPVVSLVGNKGRAKCECGHEDNKWMFSTVQRVVPISGTGILNKPQDLWAQLHIVDPANFPNEYSFLQDFCRRNPHSNRWEWQYGGEARLVKLIGPRYISRNADDVGLEMPPKKIVEHLITQNDFKDEYPDQWKAYQQARDYAQILLDPDRKIAMSMPNKITALLRLRQVLVWPNAIELNLQDEDGVVTEKIPLNVLESVKVDKAEEIIRRYTELGERVVVFSQFVGGIEELNRRLGKRSCLYYGASSPKMKQAIQTDFDIKTAPKNGEHRWDVVLAHYKSGGVGLNFSTASHVIRLDPPWNPGTGDQADARARRMDSLAKEIHVHDIRVERTVDTWMAGILSEKAAIISGFDTEASDIYRKAFDALQDGDM